MLLSVLAGGGPFLCLKFYNSNYFQLKFLIFSLDFSRWSCYNENITNKDYLLVVNKIHYQLYDDITGGMNDEEICMYDLWLCI